MKFLNYPVFQLVIFMCFGILLGYYVHISVTILIAFTVFLTLLLILLNKKTTLHLAFTIVSFLLFFAIGCSSITFKKHRNQKNHYTTFSDKNSDAFIVLKISNILKESRFYDKYEATVLQVNENNTQGKVLVNIAKDSTRAKHNVDDKLFVRGTFKEVSSSKNPFQFDYKSYLEKQQICRQLSIKNHNIKVLASSPNSLRGFAHKLRNKISKSLQKNGFNEDTLSIINALLLGKRQEISKEITENYTKAGAIHILAISGLHIGIILLFLNTIFKPIERIKNGKTIKLLLCIFLLWFFAFLAGLSASVVRAVTMFTAVAISLLGNRKTNVYQNLVISIFFLLLFNPYYIFDVGFQLSYAAVFSIVWLQPLLDKIYNPRLKIVKYLWQLFTVSIAAQIGVLPLSLYYFHQFPGLFFITNLVVIPFLGFILGFGIIIIIMSTLNILPKVFITIYEFFISSMDSFIAWVAKQESFLFENIYFSALLMIASYILIISLVYLLENKSIKTLKIAMLSLILLQIIFIYEKWKTTSTNETIVFNHHRTSFIGKRNGRYLKLYSTDSLSHKTATIKAYKTGSNIKETDIKNKIEATTLLSENILIVDSSGVYNIPELHPEKVVLIQSPKINLERLIAILKPQEIIADNSNYKSYVVLWKKTCEKHKIPFFYTNKSGAYIVNK